MNLSNLNSNRSNFLWIWQPYQWRAQRRSPKCLLRDISAIFKGAPSWWWLAMMVRCSRSTKSSVKSEMLPVHTGFHTVEGEDIFLISSPYKHAQLILRGPTPFKDMIFYLWTDSNEICTAYVKFKINHILFLKIF